MKKITKMFLLILIIIFAIPIVFFLYFFIGKINVRDKITWGVDFSQSQAEYLRLNWKETYSAIINDLGVKNIKLHTNWNWVEGQKNDFYFDDIDWQIKQAEQNNVKIIYVIGMKTGRWPECHMPDWSIGLSKSDQQAELLKYMAEVVQRYKNSKAIVYWQVENEPLFRFGECPAWYYKNDSFLKTEVALVKSLDPSRQIIISDSGEQSTWFGVAKIGDIVGITLYRNAWADVTNTFGFKAYSFLNPTTYGRKSEIIQKMFGKKVIGIELQAEPWTKESLMEAPLLEQNKSMNLEMFKENIEFAKQTGLDTFYFWGAEWWYWMKTTQNKPEIWNEAKSLFVN
ncbi:MAG: glycoside hydrolase family 2 TIM barrel-domain containing protein [Patescibacteria group bacterium]